MPVGYKSPPGSKVVNDKGYILVKVENHPEYGTGWVKEHHLVYYENTGIRCRKDQAVHHLDDNKQNNDFLNLELLEGGEHSSLHRKEGIPWNKGKTGVMPESQREAIRKYNKEKEWTEEARNKVSTFAKERQDLERDENGRFINISLTNRNGRLL